MRRNPERVMGQGLPLRRLLRYAALAAACALGACALVVDAERDGCARGGNVEKEVCERDVEGGGTARDEGHAAAAIPTREEALVDAIEIGKRALWAALRPLSILGRSSDALLEDHLVITLRVTPPTGDSRTTSFRVDLDTTGPKIWPGHRPIVITDGNRVLNAPREWGFAVLHDHVLPGRGRAFLWHLDSNELFAWLGGWGEHTLQVSIGPVSSNTVAFRFHEGGVVEVLE